MKLAEITDAYDLISRGIAEVSCRKLSMKLRKYAFNAVFPAGLTKIAFDTRRVNQETDYIPRRGLQNYHRSEKFISDAISLKVESFSKLAKLLDCLKAEYGREPEWQDSYTRVLGEAVNKGLRMEQSDGDFSDSQPSMGNLNYLEELMYVRYRLTPEAMATMSDENLRTTILSRDELLVSQGISRAKNKYEITPTDVSKYSYDQMMEKMMSAMVQVMSSYKPSTSETIIASKENNVIKTTDDRTVTITIKV